MGCDWGRPPVVRGAGAKYKTGPKNYIRQAAATARSITETALVLT
jgi:hypothetical protein